MKKKLFGIEIGSIFSMIICLIVAVAFWFFVEYFQLESTQLFNFVAFN